MNATASVLWSDVTIARRFRAMNTDIEVRVADPARLELAAVAARIFREVEARFSRFRPESELSRFNTRMDDRFDASREFIDLLERARAMHHKTRGIFEPAIIDALEASGYDRSFETVEPVGDDALTARPQRHSIGEIEIVDGVVTAPRSLRLDLGGIGKGYAVDLAARTMAAAGDFVVSAGGDMYASGRWSDADGWLASITDPLDATREISTLWLRDRALATSTTAVGRWQRGGVLRHHLIDPRTGAPADAGVTSVSVVASTTVEAEVAAKAALILGVKEGSGWLAAWGVPGLFVLDGGGVAAAPDWPGEVHR